MKEPTDGTSAGVEPPVRAQESGEASRCPHCAGTHPKTWSHCPTTGKPLTTGPALVGRVIAGRYRVLGLRGEGGMGAVYEAEHLAVGRRVALKRLHPELATDAHAVSRFQREARAAGASGHEHVVDVLDLGFAEDGAPYLVMELLAGETLAARLRRHRQLAPKRAAAIAGQVLSALEAVHALDVIHRDLKPDNIFLTKRQGRLDYVKVLDFGVSKMTAESGKDAKLTRTGVMVGTPHYMSPEQARGMRNLDHRVDLYAVGVILYECLAGQLPFQADNYHALLQSILAREPMSLTTLVPDLDPRLADVVQRALSKKPDDRFASARAMWEALVPFGAEAPARAESVAPAVSLSIAGLPTTPMEGEILQAKLREAAPSFRAVTLPTPPPLDPAPATPVWTSVPRGTGRHFVATSADWSELRGDLWRAPSLPPPSSLRPASPSMVSMPSRSRSLRPESEPFARRPATHESAGAVRVKGALVVATRTSVEERLGKDADTKAIGTLSIEHVRTLNGVVLPMVWLPIEPFVAYLDAIETANGSTDGRECRALGRLVADRELPQTHRLVLRNATPSTGLAKLPSVWRSYVDGPGMRIDGTETGSFRVEVDGGPVTHPYASLIAGLTERYLELCGAREPRVLVQNGTRGIAFAVRWR